MNVGGRRGAVRGSGVYDLVNVIVRLHFSVESRGAASNQKGDGGGK